MASTLESGMTFQPIPQADPDFRRKLLECFIESQTSAGLADWLREIGQEFKGTLQERQERVRAHTQYLSMPASDFPRQTKNYLAPFTTDELACVCLTLGLADDGPKDCLYRRIMREVGFREGWLPREVNAGSISVGDLALFLSWYSTPRRGRFEKDFYPSLAEELAEVFGNDQVYEQLPIAHGTTLKIDFHLGHPQGKGIGIEVKMPTNNSEIQRGLGQIDQYLHRYGDQFILLLVPDFMSEAALVFMTDQLRLKGVTTVVKHAE